MAAILRRMLGSALVRPLEDDWRDTLDAVARRHGWPTSREVAQLAARVADLSSAYNDASVARAAVKEAGAARLSFAFARDVPKGAGAARELVATDALRLGSAPLRVLDLGAGLGATTWGLVRALDARHRGRRLAAAPAQPGPYVVEATWLDPDAQALELGADVVRERERVRRDGVELRVTMSVRSLSIAGGLGGLGRFDVVLLGQVLSEMDVGEPDDARVGRHAALVGGLLEHATHEHGSLVVVEPALRDRTRHLHRVRDALASRGATIFAPCTHAGPCPALSRETDWCHEDLPVDLPGWLAPIARSAGLRREGLTFSYLVLRKDGLRLVGSFAAPAGAAQLRVVSELIRTKGKREAFVCGELTDAADGPRAAARVRATRLDRHASDRNAPWDEIGRGDLLVVDPAPSLLRPRIEASSEVTRSEDTESR